MSEKKQRHGESDREFAERCAGRVKFHGRYRTRREVFEYLRNSKEWRCAFAHESELSWTLTLDGTATLAVWKNPPTEAT